MKKTILNIYLTIAGLFLAYPVFAETTGCSTGGAPQSIHDLLNCYIAYKIEKYIPLLIIIAVVVFLYGVLKFISAGDNEEARQSGRNVMIYGIIVLFVMVSIWGLVGIVYNTFITGSVTLPTQLPALITN